MDGPADGNTSDPADGTSAPTSMPSARDAVKKAERRAFVKDNVIVFVTQIFGKLKGIIVLPMLVKGMGVEQYGVWVQILSFSSLAMALIAMNLHLPLLRFFKVTGDPQEKREHNARLYSTLLAATLVQTTVLCALLYALAPPSAADVFLGTADRACLFYGLALVVLGAARNLNLGFYRAEGRFLVRSVVDLGATLVELVAVVIAIRGGTSLVPALHIMTLIGIAIVVLTSAHILYRSGLRAPNGGVLRTAYRYTTPLLPAAVCLWILDRSDRFIIAHFLDDAAVGRYSTYYALGSLLTFLFGPLQSTLIPRVAQLWDNDRSGAIRHVEDSMKVYVLLALPGIAGIAALSEPLLAIMTTPQIAEGSRASTFFIASGVASWGFSILLSSFFFANKETGVVSTVSVLTAALNLGLNCVLVPRIGVVASGLVTLVSYAVTCAAFALRARRVTKVRYPVREFVVGAVGASVMFALLFFWNPRHLALVAVAGATGLVLYGAIAAAGGVLPIARLRSLVRRRT